MGKKIIRLTESDLIKIVKRVLSEDDWGGKGDPNASSAGMEQPHYYFKCDDEAAKKKKYEALNLYTKNVRKFLFELPNFEADGSESYPNNNKTYPYWERYYYNNEDFDYDDSWKRVPPPFDIAITYFAEDDCNTCKLIMTGTIFSPNKPVEIKSQLNLIGVKYDDVIKWIMKSSYYVFDKNIYMSDPGMG